MYLSAFDSPDLSGTPEVPSRTFGTLLSQGGRLFQSLFASGARAGDGKVLLEGEVSLFPDFPHFSPERFVHQ